jgi:hypothetical protein
LELFGTGSAFSTLTAIDSILSGLDFGLLIMATESSVNPVFQVLATAVLSGSVIAALIGIFAKRRAASIENEIKMRFDELAARSSSKLLWKQQSVATLLGPVNMQLDRTERAFKRYEAGNLYLEAKVIREGNQCIRDLLLANGHLIPPDLLDDAGKLVEHYDRWLEEFDRLRDSEKPALDQPFVFVGVGENARPFPRSSADRFQQRFRQMWTELYETEAHPARAANG